MKGCLLVLSLAVMVGMSTAWASQVEQASPDAVTTLQQHRRSLSAAKAPLQVLVTLQSWSELTLTDDVEQMSDL